MKILLIHNKYRYLGGEETYVQNISKLLRAEGHTIIQYSKDTKKASIKDKFLIVFYLFWNPSIMKDIKDLVQKKHPDVALVQNIFPLIGPTVYWALKKQGIPIIQRISNYRLVCPKTNLYRNSKVCELCVSKKIPYYSVLFGCYNQSRVSSLLFALSIYFHKYIIKSFQNVNIYIFPSNFIEKYIKKYFYIPESKSRVIKTFAFPLSNYEKVEKDTKFHYFLYAGRLSEEKGIKKLIEIFKLKRFENIHLIILGNGPLKNEVSSLIKNCSNVTYKGSLLRRRVMHYLENSLALIMPSLWFDVLPNVALESFSVGTPVIAPNLGTFSSLINDGRNGYKYKDVNDLKNILYKLNSGRFHIKKSIIRRASSAYLDTNSHYKQLFKIIAHVQNAL
ncbi:MAG: glycosyltransferase family 4 protein [Candidatus Roizmanbacteria bacterium]|nr:glycosyltransferase family 4 protein [Candidatus Roizmanbacteria bacterium]